MIAAWISAMACWPSCGSKFTRTASATG